MKARARRWVVRAVCVIAGMCLAGLSQAKVNPADAVGVWLFDEGAGDAAKDISAKGNHGKLVKSPKWVKGKFGSALEFNGQDTCVQTEKKLLEAVQEFTITAWIKPGAIVASRIGLVGQNDTVEFGLIAPTTLEVWSEAAGTGLDIPYPHPKDEWHHVAAAGTPKVLQLLIDGSLSEKVVAVANHGSSVFNVNIGGCGVFDGAGNHFTGVIDDVAIFHKALAKADIGDIMTQGLGKLLGATAVRPGGKIALTWGSLKTR